MEFVDLAIVVDELGVWVFEFAGFDNPVLAILTKN